MAHISECPACRGALFTLLADTIPGEPVPYTAACDECQNDLAAFIDLERSQGSAAALAAYPAIWWHLWTCTLCAETYHLTNVLLDAEQDGSLAPLPIEQPVDRVRPLVSETLRLPRRFLHQALGMSAVLGPAWGTMSDDTVLIEQELADLSMTVRARQQNEAEWAVTLTIDPPTTGQTLLQFGTHEFQAPFTPEGTARVPSVPAPLLTAADGPDMVIVVELL